MQVSSNTIAENIP